MEDNIIKIRNILIDLDTLLDTRIALLYLLDDKIATTVSKDGSYAKRLKDNFGLLSNDIFKSFYNRRNKVLLSLALPTNIIKLVRQHYGDEVTTMTQVIESEKPILYVNTYPYNLTLDEQKIFELVILKLIPKSRIVFINLDNNSLTPDWVNDNVGVIFKYDILDWVNLHMSNFNLINKPLITVNAIAPALLQGIVSTKDANKETFMNMTYTLSTVIDLSFIDAFHFSAANFKKK